MAKKLLSDGGAIREIHVSEVVDVPSYLRAADVEFGVYDYVVDFATVA